MLVQCPTYDCLTHAAHHSRNEGNDVGELVLIHSLTSMTRGLGRFFITSAALFGTSPRSDKPVIFGNET